MSVTTRVVLELQLVCALRWGERAVVVQVPDELGEHNRASESIKAVPVRRYDDLHMGGVITLSYTGVQFGPSKSPAGFRRAKKSGLEPEKMPKPQARWAEQWP